MKRCLLKVVLACAFIVNVGCFANVDTTVHSITESKQSILDKFGNFKVYYIKNGNSFHLDENCPRLSKSLVLSGILKATITL